MRKYKIVNIALAVFFLIGCTSAKSSGVATESSNDTVVVMEEHTARYPYDKEIVYKLCNEKKEDNICLTAMFFKKRITAISIYVRNCADTNRADRESMDIDNDTMAVECNSIEISKRESFFKVPNGRQMKFVRDILGGLDKKYGLEDLKCISTTTDIWGNASVDISKEYAKQKTQQHGNALIKTIYNSMLFRDINQVLAIHGLTINNVWSDDNPSFKTKKQFLKENIMECESMPDTFIMCHVEFETRKIKAVK